MPDKCVICGDACDGELCDDCSDEHGDTVLGLDDFDDESIYD
jgi:hypothetical protein